MARLAHYRKALAAFVPAVVALIVALGVDVSGEVVAAVLVVVETATVFFVPPNAPHPNDTIGWHWENGEPVRD
jgi:hypothetical protein